MVGHMQSIIEAAIKRAGRAPKVATKLGITRISVYEWIKKGRVPSDRVIPLSELTDWEFTPHMIDSSLYPNPTDGMPRIATKRNSKCFMEAASCATFRK